MEVSNSRNQKRLNQVWRRRRCKECGAIYTTHEALDLSQALSVRKNGILTPLVRDKLFMSIFRSCQHRKDAVDDAGALTDTILSTVSLRSEKGAVDASLIVHVASETLARFDKVAVVHYEAFHPRAAVT
ncbi:MAG TPA: hypothetical protein VHD60_01005 [Candidatus Saccharimonadales bacterium]|nr:hypothetical protein [Candidatus Saccharimonadales bacterium]